MTSVHSIPIMLMLMAVMLTALEVHSQPNRVDISNTDTLSEFDALIRSAKRDCDKVAKVE